MRIELRNGLIGYYLVKICGGDSVGGVGLFQIDIHVSMLTSTSGLWYDLFESEISPKSLKRLQSCDQTK